MTDNLINKNNSSSLYIGNKFENDKIKGENDNKNNNENGQKTNEEKQNNEEKKGNEENIELKRLNRVLKHCIPPPVHPKFTDILFNINENGSASICLNRSTSLNSLTIQMLDHLYQTLIQWQKNSKIKYVLLYSISHKSFCAGGDLKEFRNNIQEFVYKEYRLNTLIYYYQKPIISIMNGIVMGGGAGLAMNAKFRVTTNRLKFAMPEVKIGWFVDCSSSHFLSLCPQYYGRYVALTSAVLNSDEALFLGLVSHLLLDDNEENNNNNNNSNNTNSNNNGDNVNSNDRNEVVYDNVNNNFVINNVNKKDKYLWDFIHELEVIFIIIWRIYDSN